MKQRFTRECVSFLRRFRTYNQLEAKFHYSLSRVRSSKEDSDNQITESTSNGGYVSESGIKQYEGVDGFDYSNYRSQIKSNYEALSNSTLVYEDLVMFLKNMPCTQIRPLRTFMNEITDQERVVALRHDIDVDPEMGVKIAKILSREGVPGTFYLLHSATYYGQFVGNTLVRNPMIRSWVRDFIVSGCELGVHNDALGVTNTLGIDGIQALLNELNYLRSLGANITGTVAHNSFPTQMAENFEVFQEHCLWQRDNPEKDGLLQLGAINQIDHQLFYEGNFPLKKEKIDTGELKQFLETTPDIRSEEWMQKYLQDNPYMMRDYDNDIWVLGKDLWCCCARRKEDRFFRVDATFPEMLEFLNTRPPLSRTVITLHPEYFSSS